MFLEVPVWEDYNITEKGFALASIDKYEPWPGDEGEYTQVTFVSGDVVCIAMPYGELKRAIRDAQQHTIWHKGS